MSAGGLTQRQLESLEMSLMDKEDEKMGVGRTTERLLVTHFAKNFAFCLLVVFFITH